MSHLATQGQFGEGSTGASEAQQSRHSVTCSQGMRKNTPKIQTSARNSRRLDPAVETPPCSNRLHTTGNKATFFYCLNKVFPLCLHHGKSFSFQQRGAESRVGDKGRTGHLTLPEGPVIGGGLLLVCRQRGQPGDSQSQPLSTVPWAGKAPFLCALPPFSFTQECTSAFLLKAAVVAITRLTTNGIRGVTSGKSRGALPMRTHRSPVFLPRINLLSSQDESCQFRAPFQGKDMHLEGKDMSETPAWASNSTGDKTLPAP